MPLITIYFILSVCNNLYAQGYYYQGRYISLQERNDGIAIVTKSYFTDTIQIKSNIKQVLPGDAYIKGITDNFVYIKFENEKSRIEISDLKNSLSSKLNNIKFITSVYYGESRQVTQIPTDEFIVKLRNKKDSVKLDILNLQNNVIKFGIVDDARALVLKTTDLSSKNALELTDIYYKTGLFDYAEPNFLIPAEGFFNWTPNDPYYSIQWPLNNTGQTVNTGGYSQYGDSIKSSGFLDADMDVNLAWDFVKGNQNVTVAVFDTGVDSLHPDLSGNLIRGYNANSNNNTVTTDPGYHGTCTIGIIGARTNNNIGISGIVGGDNGSNHCKICSYRLVTDDGLFISDVNIARAFDTARVRGVHVSSNSWGGGTPSTTLMNAINNCAINGRGGLGCVILFSSGNNGRNPPNYPSYLPNVVCIGASTNIDSKKSPGTGDQFWWGGCYGEDANGDLDLVAPTITITTDIRGSGGYSSTDYDSTFNGTSCSCPNAAGVTALIFSVNPNFTRNQVIDYLYRGCDKIDNLPYSTNKTYGKWNPYTGYGRVNAYNSVRLAAGVDVTPPTINHTNAATSISTYPFIVSAEIIDQDGNSVPTSGLNAPKLYYRKNKNNTGWTVFANTPASTNAGNTFYFKIPCSGWQTEIEYYISAKDNFGNEALFPKNSPDYPCYTAVGTITMTSGTFSRFNLPQSGVAISPILTMINYKILNTQITLNITHSYVSDFNLILWNPSSDTKRNKVCLFSRNDGSGNNIDGATVSDEGMYFWRESFPPYTNLSAKPEHTFSGFKGMNSGGNWKLLYYDAAAPDGGRLTSAILSITRLSGIVSPCARLDFETDSIAFFPDISSIYDTVDFYLKNVGNAPLTISSYNFSGTYAENFSIINTPPASIAINDSGLFKIMLTNIFDDNKKKEPADAFENAVLNINNNDPSKFVFRVSLQSDSPLPVVLESFTSSVAANNVKLNWITASEENNSGFEIQKTEYRSQETEVWNKVGFVKGNGSKNSATNYSFEEKNLQTGKYKYRLKQIDYNGNYKYFELAGVVEVGVPAKFDLSQNYPNPFNPVTKINFALPQSGLVSLKIYDVLGKEIAVVINEMKDAGYYTVSFDASGLSSGVYFYRLSSNGFSSVKRMVVLK
ncbi:MAG: S8 family serine peptidase [Ignavibacteria bacterium]|nr:S8 family serine peptidase [Ignavibacteria bacterium]